MAKLADITSETRILIKVVTGFLISIAALFIIVNVGQFVIKTFFTPTPPPEHEFGKLPSIQFPKQTPPVLEYRINTLDGTLPIFPERMNVYQVKRSEPSIVSLQNARSVVRGGGYIHSETKINDAVYQWTDADGRRIEYNILTNNFKIGSNYAPSETATDFGTALSTKEGAFETTTDFLGKLSDDTSDLDPEKTSLLYLKIDNGRIVQAESPNEAQYLRVDLFQSDLDKYEIFYPTPKQSTMYFVYTTQAGFPSISEANYVHYRTDKENVSDYYIKTAEEAFEDLKRGKAFVWIENTKNKIVDITEVSLGYYVGEQNQNFFIPIAVFKGNGFLAYVQAIPDDLVED